MLRYLVYVYFPKCISMIVPLILAFCIVSYLLTYNILCCVIQPQLNPNSVEALILYAHLYFVSMVLLEQNYVFYFLPF